MNKAKCVWYKDSTYQQGSTEQWVNLCGNFCNFEPRNFDKNKILQYLLNFPTILQALDDSKWFLFT